jgi:hypothetical protein
MLPVTHKYPTSYTFELQIEKPGTRLCSENYYPSIQEAKEGGCKFKFSLGYIVRPCLKMEGKKDREREGEKEGGREGRKDGRKEG